MRESGSGGPAERAEAEKAGKKAGAYRLEDTRLDGKLGSLAGRAPEGSQEQPGAHEASADRVARRGAPARLAPLGRGPGLSPGGRLHPGQAGQALPGGDWRFEARAYFDPETRKWRVAARYVAGQADVALEG